MQIINYGSITITAPDEPQVLQPSAQATVVPVETEVPLQITHIENPEPTDVQIDAALHVLLRTELKGGCFGCGDSTNWNNGYINSLFPHYKEMIRNMLKAARGV